MDKPIYIIHGDSGSNRYFLGHATGDLEDIKAYYDSRKGYQLTIEEIKPIHIPKEYANVMAKLVSRKTELELQIKEINNTINNLGKMP